MIQFNIKRASILTIIFVILVNTVKSYSQEYEVESFEIMPNDLTARIESRVDGNGRKCGVIKIYVKDSITDVSGSVVGNVIDKGFEKRVYVSHDTKQIDLYFSQHMPLHLIFDDFNYTTVSGNMTYCLKLKEVSTNNTIENGYDQFSTVSENSPSIEINSTITIPSNGYINGHEYIDLGLPSNTKWATCNIGASSPEFCGNYFAWGEISPQKSYEGKYSNTYGKSKETLISNGIISTDGELKPSYDAATVNWGEEWKMPNKQECEELIQLCKWEWCKVGKTNGYQITGPNGNSIFIPASGYKYKSSENYVGKGGGILSSTCDDDNYSLYCVAICTDKTKHYLSRYLRYEGRAIRPVLAKINYSESPK